MKGIDVSNAQGNIDWNKVKADGIEFAIIRLGWGGNAINQDDPKFNQYVTECERIGLPWGAYLYSYALTLDNVDNEIEHSLRVLKGKKPTLGVWFDMEDADHYKQKHGINVYQNRRLITDMCKKYVDGMTKNGYDTGVYASSDYFKNVIYRNELTCPIWLAIWGPSQPSMPCKMWQYTSKGSVSGINGNVDMDIFYGENVTPIPKPAEPTCKITIEKIICKMGSSNDDVKLLQWLLNSKGHNCGDVDGIFGSKTKAAVLNYQRDHIECGTPDGTCGPKTWTSLLS